MTLSAMMMGSGHPPEAYALFARMTTPPSGARKKQISVVIQTLKKAGVWAKLDVLYVFAAATSQAALLNWKGGSFTATNNSATFTADRGLTGNGSSAYVATGYTQGNGQSSLNSFTAGVSVRAVPTSSWKVAMGASDGANQSCLISVLPYASNLFIGRSATDSAISTGLSGQANLAVIKDGPTIVAYRNGLLLGSKPSTLTAPVSVPLYLMATNSNGSAGGHFDGRIAAAHFGAKLSVDEMADLDAALQAYLNAVGA